MNRIPAEHHVLLKKYRDLVAQNPDSSRALFKLGTALISVGFMSEGQATLERALELDPRCVEAWVNLGGACLSRWDFEGCVKANGKALQCDPKLTRAHFNQGLGYLYLGRVQKMIACFQKVLDLEPENAAAHYHLAVGFRAAGEIDLARASVAKALSLGYSPDPSFLKALEEDSSVEGLVQIMEVGPDPEK